MQPLILYHGRGCSDGFGAAWAAWLALGDAADYQAVDYGEPIPETTAERDVYIVDFSYPPAELERAVREYRPTWLEILDHHETAVETLLPWLRVRGPEFQTAGPVRVTLDTAHSGAALAWQRFHGERELPRLLAYIEDRDLWRWQLPESRAVSAWLRSFPQDFALWSDLAGELEADFSLVTLEGCAILRAQARAIEGLLREPQWRPIGGEVVPVVNTPLYISEVGDALCQRYPEAAFVACYEEGGDGRRRWHLRSHGRANVARVAEAYGGGGHPDASGFSVPFGEAP